MPVRENDNHPMTNGTYDWGVEPDNYCLYLNGEKIPGVSTCVRDACIRSQRFMVECAMPPFSAITIVNERTNVVECVVTDDANGIVYHKPDMGDR